jgi:hypothetical protein
MNETDPSSARRDTGLGLPEVVADAIRYWERRRIAYNLVLSAVVFAWIIGTWPHFRPAFKLSSLLFLVVLSALANLCYCAAYAADIPIQYSPIRSVWRHRRWTLWLAGTLFALLLANYWIADEVFPFVR